MLVLDSLLYWGIALYCGSVGELQAHGWLFVWRAVVLGCLWVVWLKWAVNGLYYIVVVILLHDVSGFYYIRCMELTTFILLLEGYLWGIDLI